MFTFHIFLRIIAILITSYITAVGVPLTFTFNTLWVALLSVVVIAIINHTIKPIIHIITLPINALTLGLFSFVINGAMIYLASFIIPGFYIPSMIMGIIFSIVLSVVNFVLHVFQINK